MGLVSAPPMTTRYVLNSAVLTAPGVYEYVHLSHSAAAAWLIAGPFVSNIGFEVTAAAFETLFGIHPDVNRQRIRMEPGDEALIFRLSVRVGEPQFKQRLSRDFVLRNHEVGVLRRIR